MAFKDRNKPGHDQFGFKLGSKKSIACEMYVDGGASSEDVRQQTGGGTQLQVLYEVAAQGHRVYKKNGFNMWRHTVKLYHIEVNPDPIGKIRYRSLKKADMEQLGFKPYAINALATIYLFPKYLYRDLPRGLNVYTIFGGRYVVGDEELSPNTTHRSGEGYLEFGLLPSE